MKFYFQFAEYGSEGSTLLLQTCLDQMLVKDGDILPVKKELLSAVVKYLLDKPHFSTNLSEALNAIPINEYFLGDISNTLGMSVAEKIGVGIALLDSDNPDLKMKGKLIYWDVRILLFSPHIFQSAFTFQSSVL